MKVNSLLSLPKSLWMNINETWFNDPIGASLKRKESCETNALSKVRSFQLLEVIYHQTSCSANLMPYFLCVSRAHHLVSHTKLHSVSWKQRVREKAWNVLGTLFLKTFTVRGSKLGCIHLCCNEDAASFGHVHGGFPRLSWRGWKSHLAEHRLHTCRMKWRDSRVLQPRHTTLAVGETVSTLAWNTGMHITDTPIALLVEKLAKKRLGSLTEATGWCFGKSNFVHPDKTPDSISNVRRHAMAITWWPLELALRMLISWGSVTQ